MNPIDIENRVHKAQNLFRMGYNCSQAVFAACADIYGLNDQELALRLSSPFGGGIGGMRKTCGACCGMYMVEGLRSGNTLSANPQGKRAHYAQVQRLANRFRQEYGSTTCATLLAMKGGVPCVEKVGEAVRIVLNN